MANTGQEIVERQNLPKNIARLAAQKEMYFNAKRLFLLQFILTAVITVGLAAITIVLAAFSASLDLNWVRASYGVAATGADIFLINHFINQLRQRAACVQELFDCDVLSLKWNRIC